MNNDKLDQLIEKVSKANKEFNDCLKEKGITREEWQKIKELDKKRYEICEKVFKEAYSISQQKSPQ